MRVGGDEFIVLLPDVAPEADALVVAHKNLHALTQPLERAGHALHIAASIGVAVYPENGSDEEQLLKSADDAKYQGKKQGGAATFLSVVDAAAFLIRDAGIQTHTDARHTVAPYRFTEVALGTVNIGALGQECGGANLIVIPVCIQRCICL